MAKRGAVFCTGHLRDYRKHLDSFCVNLVEPNDLDVYLSVDRKSSIVDRTLHGPSVSDEHDEEAYLRSKLGTRLKVLHWANEDPGLDEARHLCQSLVQHRTGTPRLWTEFVDQFVRLSYLVRWVERQSSERFSSYAYMLRFRIDIHVENLMPLGRMLQPIELQPNQVWVRPDWSHSVKELWVCDPPTFLRIAYNFPYLYGNHVPADVQSLPNYGVPEYQLGQFLRDGQFQVFQWHLEFGYRDDFVHNTRWVYTATPSNFLKADDPLFLTRFPTSLRMDDLERVEQSPSIEFHPVAAEHQPELFRIAAAAKAKAKAEAQAEVVAEARAQAAADQAAADAAVVFGLSQASSSSSDYVWIILLAVVATLLVATNLLWWRSQRIKSTLPPPTVWSRRDESLVTA